MTPAPAETNPRAALDALPRFPERERLHAVRELLLAEHLAALPASERAAEAERWSQVEARAAAMSAAAVGLERRAERPQPFETFRAALARLSRAFNAPPIPEADALLLYASDGDDAARAWWAFHGERV